MASSLEDMDEVVSYAKNYNLDFTIPYTMNGEEKNYYPDFVVRMKAPSPLAGEGGGEGASGELNLIVEVTGEHKKDKAGQCSAEALQSLRYIY